MLASVGYMFFNHSEQNSFCSSGHIALIKDYHVAISSLSSNVAGGILNVHKGLILLISLDQREY